MTGGMTPDGDDVVVGQEAERAGEHPGEPDGFERLWTPHRMVYIGGQGKPSDASAGQECPFCRAPTLDDA